VRRGQLEQDLDALRGDGTAFGDDVQGPQVMRTGILVPEARGGLPGREERVSERVLPRRRSRGQQMRRDPGRGTRPRLEYPADGQVDRGPGGRAEPVEDGLAVEIVAEPRLGGAHDDAGLTGLVEQAQGRGLIADRDLVTSGRAVC